MIMQGQIIVANGKNFKIFQADNAVLAVDGALKKVFLH